MPSISPLCFCASMSISRPVPLPISSTRDHAAVLSANQAPRTQASVQTFMAQRSCWTVNCLNLNQELGIAANLEHRARPGQDFPRERRLPFRPRAGAYRHWREIAGKIFVMPGDGDHGRVIGAIFEGWDECPPAFARAQFLERLAQPAIGGDAAGDAKIGDARLAGRLPEFGQQDRDDALLDGCADIGQVGVDKSGVLISLLAEKIKNGRFETAETEIQR